MNEWRYVSRGERLHCIGSSGSLWALCGLTVFDASEWLGTGSQQEYERAAAMGLCRRCSRRVDQASHPARSSVGTTITADTP